MALMYLLAITAASRSIDLSAAYFAPDALTTKALVAAIGRGVKVRIIVPGEHIDSDTSRFASRARWGPVLQAGALIAEYKPTMYHCKALIVNTPQVSVGPTNFGNRLFHLNDEATLNILDPAFAAEQTRVFEDDLQLSRPVTRQQWTERPWRGKAADYLVSPIGSQV
jgi:cardiolipin synthase